MTGPGAAGFPDPLVERAHAALRPFGFATASGEEDDWPAMWERLKGDIASRGRAAMPSFGTLTVAQRQAALAYMQARRRADLCLADCRTAHVALHRGGINAEVVERYSAAREAYEESVEQFGAAREALAGVLG